MIDLEALSKRLVDEGRLIEAGWISLRIAAIPPEASQIQIDEMRNAFFAGAQHLYGSIMTILDPGEEPTDADLARMEKIDDELRAFIDDYQARFVTTEGSA